METINKVIKDGKVAIVHSADFGHSLYSNYKHKEELLFSPTLVELVEKGQSDAINSELLKHEFGIDVSDSAWGGFTLKLQVTYIPVGTKFCVVEHDGKETIITQDQLTLEA